MTQLHALVTSNLCKVYGLVASTTMVWGIPILIFVFTLIWSTVWMIGIGVRKIHGLILGRLIFVIMSPVGFPFPTITQLDEGFGWSKNACPANSTLSLLELSFKGLTWWSVLFSSRQWSLSLIISLFELDPYYFVVISSIQSFPRFDIALVARTETTLYP